MHRLPNGDVVWRYRLASFLYLCVGLCALGTVGCFCYEVYDRGHRYLYYGIASAALGFVFFLWMTFLSIRLRCPLCMVQPFMSKGCSRNRGARSLFGSYRLKVAVDVLLRGHFRCPYCGEPTAMEARRRK